jgi:hypothetical protein
VAHHQSIAGVLFKVNPMTVWVLHILNSVLYRVHTREMIMMALGKSMRRIEQMKSKTDIDDGTTFCSLSKPV